MTACPSDGPALGGGQRALPARAGAGSRQLSILSLGAARVLSGFPSRAYLQISVSSLDICLCWVERRG